MNRGLMVSFEGLDASGKGTVIEKVINRLKDRQIPYFQTREPGGTKIAEQLRSIILEPSNDMHMNTEIMLYASSRSELVHRLIKPALQEGKIVICDRYVDSSIAYQGYGAGHNEEVIKQIKAVNQFATGSLIPDRTFLIDITVEESIRRKYERSKETHIILDRIEQRAKEFHQRVYEGYHQIAKQEPERVVVVDGTLPPNEVFEQVYSDLETLIKTGEKQ